MDFHLSILDEAKIRFKRLVCTPKARRRNPTNPTHSSSNKPYPKKIRETEPSGEAEYARAKKHPWKRMGTMKELYGTC